MSLTKQDFSHIKQGLGTIMLVKIFLFLHFSEASWQISFRRTQCSPSSKIGSQTSILPFLYQPWSRAMVKNFFFLQSRGTPHPFKQMKSTQKLIYEIDESGTAQAEEGPEMAKESGGLESLLCASLLSSFTCFLWRQPLWHFQKLWGNSLKTHGLVSDS